jgi:hypothetical protein
VATGCSSNSSTSEDQLTTVTTILSKGYEMTVEQRQAFDNQIKQAKELMKSGSNEEAQKILAKVLADLEVIEETDRFNKSE